MRGFRILGLGAACALFAMAAGCASQGQSGAAEAGGEKNVRINVEARVVNTMLSLKDIAAAVDAPLRPQFVIGSNDVLLIDNLAIKELLRTVQNDEHSLAVSAPHVTVFDRTPATLEISQNIWRENGELHLGSATRPLDVMSTLDLTPKVGKDGTFLDFKLVRNITPTARTDGMTRTVAAGNAVWIPAGRTLMVPIKGESLETGKGYLLVRPRVMTDAEE